MGEPKDLICLHCKEDKLIPVYTKKHEKEIEQRVFWCKNCGSIKHVDIDKVERWTNPIQIYKYIQSPPPDDLVEDLKFLDDEIKFYSEGIEPETDRHTQDVVYRLETIRKLLQSRQLMITIGEMKSLYKEWEKQAYDGRTSPNYWNGADDILDWLFKNNRLKSKNSD